MEKKKYTLKELEKMSPKELEETMFTKDGTPKCVVCGKPMEMAYDSITKKKSKYSWKPTCNCCGKRIRLMML